MTTKNQDLSGQGVEDSSERLIYFSLEPLNPGILDPFLPFIGRRRNNHK
jgi:hypothetical protein